MRVKDNMPTYEYKCTRCGYVFERFQSIKEPPYTKCPECNGLVKRLIGAGSGILFKGSGFYITDYRTSSYKEKERKEKQTTSPGQTKDKIKGKG